MIVNSMFEPARSIGPTFMQGQVSFAKWTFVKP